jgi:PhzF family phenazine biosynthesis protein
LFENLDQEGDVIVFHSQSGPLAVWKDNDFLVMDFPARPAEPVETPDHLVAGLGREVETVLESRDLLVVLEDEKAVQDLQPDFSELEKIDCEGVIVTAPGNEVDFVSRFFAPRMGINEDPVTGAAHSTLTPFWAERLGKNRLRARQISDRGGDLWCMLRDDRVHIAGQAVSYVKGFLTID